MNKYIVKYKESDSPNQWRYFQSFYKSTYNHKDKIGNSYKNEEAKILSYEEGEIVIDTIKQIYIKNKFYSLKRIESRMIEGKKVSRFELIDI